MDISKYNTLNEMYEPIHKKAFLIYKDIKNKGYKASYGWYNMHSLKYNDKYLTEFFPIPVITVENIGEIGIDIDFIFFEATISKEKALNIDYDDLTDSYSIEVYGADDYLHDFYNSNIPLSDVKTNIQKSSETQIHIAAYFDINVGIDELLGLSRKTVINLLQ